MKKSFLIIFTVLISLILSSCSTKTTEYSVEKNGVTYTVNSANSTISDGEFSYIYDFKGSADSYDFDVTYPNGSTYFWQQQDIVGTGGWSNDYSKSKYADGELLRDVVLENAPKTPITSDFWLGIFIFAVGVLNVVKPKIAWTLSYGWRYKNAEPSNIALILGRVSGVILVVIAHFIVFL